MKITVDIGMELSYSSFHRTRLGIVSYYGVGVMAWVETKRKI